MECELEAQRKQEPHRYNPPAYVRELAGARDCGGLRDLSKLAPRDDSAGDGTRRCVLGVLVGECRGRPLAMRPPFGQTPRNRLAKKRGLTCASLIREIVQRHEQGDASFDWKTLQSVACVFAPVPQRPPRHFHPLFLFACAVVACTLRCTLRCSRNGGVNWGSDLTPTLQSAQYYLAQLGWRWLCRRKHLQHDQHDNAKAKRPP